MRICTLLLLCVASALLAQERWQPGEREALRNREQRMSREDLESRRALCARIIESLSPEERARFHALPLPEKERFIHERMGERAAKATQEYLDSINDEERAAFTALSEAERNARIQTWRVEREFSRALSAATERGLLTDARREELCNLDTAAKAAATYELMKATVLAIHGPELARLPAQERERVAQLPPAQFFRDPALVHLRVGHFVSPNAMQTLQNAAPEDKNHMLAELVEGRLEALGPEGLRPGAQEEFAQLPRAERERLVENVGRLLAGERHLNGVTLGMLIHHLEKLPEPERQRFLAMPSGAALHALQDLHQREQAPPRDRGGLGPEPHPGTGPRPGRPPGAPRPSGGPPKPRGGR
jgi:hypothetical protein